MIKQIYIKHNRLITIVSLLLIVCTSNTFAQNKVYSTIAKNIHPDGRSLLHELNPAGDTLHLKSTYKLYKVEFIGNGESKEFWIEGNKSEAWIPLASVPVGEYTIAGFQIERNDEVYQYQKTIIFRISRLLPIEIAKETHDDVAETLPEIQTEEPLVEEDTSIAHVEETGPVLEEPEMVEQTKPVKVKPDVADVMKKKRLKKKERPMRTRRLAGGSSDTKSFVESRKEYDKKSKTVTDDIKKSERLVETKKPRLDTTEYQSYNLTTQRGGQYVVQSREDYRRNNLRPNGQPYD